MTAKHQKTQWIVTIITYFRGKVKRDHNKVHYEIPRFRRTNWQISEVYYFFAYQLDRFSCMLAKLYMKEIVRLHAIQNIIVSDRDKRFTSRPWKGMHESLGTKLYFSIIFHHQTKELINAKRFINVVITRPAGSTVNES